MRLELALQSDMGDTVTTEGKIGYVGKPNNITGVKNGKAYDFWGQFVTITDGEASVGVGMSFDAQAACITEQQKGQNIRIKGLMASYEKDGKKVLKIDRAKLTSPLAIESKPATQPAKQTDVQTSIIRQCCIKAAAAFYTNRVKIGDGEGKDALDVISAARLFEAFVLGVSRHEPAPEDTRGEPAPQDTTDYGEGDQEIPF